MFDVLIRPTGLSPVNLKSTLLVAVCTASVKTVK